MLAQEVLQFCQDADGNTPTLHRATLGDLQNSPANANRGDTRLYVQTKEQMERPAYRPVFVMQFRARKLPIGQFYRLVGNQIRTRRLKGKCDDTSAPSYQYGNYL